MSGRPIRMKVSAPAARYGPKGMCWRRLLLPGRDEGDTDHRAVEEPGEEAGRDVPPAQLAEEGAQQERNRTSPKPIPRGETTNA